MISRSPYGLLGLGVACVLGACDSGEVGDLDRALLRVGYSQEPPYAFIADDGRVTGEAPETLRRVTQALAVEEVQWIRLEFDELIPNLLDGRVDIVGSGLFETPARAERVRFSRPTVCARAALVAREEAASQLRPADDPWSVPDLTFVVLAESVEANAAERLGLPRGRVLTVYDVRTGVAALERGEGDVMAVTLPTARWILQEDLATDLRLVGPYEPPEGAEFLRGCSAFALRLEDTALAAAVDSVLAEFVGTQEHLDLIRTFGFHDEMVPTAEGSPSGGVGGPGGGRL